MKRILLIGVLIIAFAIEGKSQCMSDLDSCTAPGRSSSAKVRGLQSLFEKYEKLVQVNYDQLLSKLDAEHKAVIIDSQKDWLKYKEKEFKIIQRLYEIDHGSDELVFMEEYKVDLVKDRALQLQKCYELLHLD